MKKIAAVLFLLVLLTSCGVNNEEEQETSTGGESVSIDANTNSDEEVADVNASGSLNEDQILGDIDNLLDEIVTTTDDGTSTGGTSTGVSTSK